MKKPSLHSCNILGLSPAARRLWQFVPGDGDVSLTAEQTLAPAQPLPSKGITKDWRSLWQRKVNIAWLPADQIFLRVVDFPTSDVSELKSMVEFQLEKLSPLPVNQIVWTIEPLLQSADNLRTVIVLIAARSMVEEFLGRLEGEGYLADCLELPCLHQLLTTRAEEDGVWIFPSREDEKQLCLVAWWFGGRLRQLELLHLAETSERTGSLRDHLTRMAWAGEMEDWLTAPIRCHVVAEVAARSRWESELQPWAGEAVVWQEPASPFALAQLSAQRVAGAAGQANLLPAEYAARYQQQFIDRLWMNGLGAIVAAYLVGVLIYFGALQVLKFQKRGLEKQVAALSASYTNAVKLKARAEVLQNQLNLKYAGLECLRVASELLPPELTLTRFNFNKGRALRLEGTVPTDQVNQLTDYNAALRKATVQGEQLFSKVDRPNWSQRGQSFAWHFNCELERRELE